VEAINPKPFLPPRTTKSRAAKAFLLAIFIKSFIIVVSLRRAVFK
jgi:hypothetical protein